MMKLQTMTAWVNALLRCEISAEEAVRTHLARIDAADGQVGAFLTVFAEDALRRAREIDASAERPPLAGLPVALKDNICTAGQRTTCASRMLADFVPPYSAHVWEKLSAAGGILLGKTNMDEFGMGASTEHSAFRTTRDPHDLRRSPGGSSGGSAAAVAAGEVFLALGSDTGGSVRQPSAHCGVVGMKPTYGRVSRYGLVAFASSLEQIGPITRNVADNALALELIAGRDVRDATTVNHPADMRSGLGRGVQGLRVGLPREMFAGQMSKEVRAAVLHAADVLAAQGASITEVSLPSFRYALPAYYILSAAEASSNLARFDGVRYGRRAEDHTDLESLYVRSRSEGFGDEVKRRIMLGTYVLSEGYYDAYYAKASRVRTLVVQEFDRAFTQADVLLAPVTPSTAPLLGENADPVAMYQGDLYTVPANIAGIPALSMPCASDAGGLPIGVQLMGARFAEPLLYQAGEALEAALGKVVREVQL